MSARALSRLAAVLAIVALAAQTASAPAASPQVAVFSTPMPIPPTITDADVTLTAKQTDVQILPGAATRMWTFNGTFPGPTIRRPTGTPTRVTVVNDLPVEAGELTLHHHGAHVAAKDDGQPADELIPHGAARTYTYGMMEAGEPERGATQWYHDHRMDVTGRNVWMGLAGMFILDDPAEAAVNAALPNGAYDVPVMVVDRAFDSANQIPYRFSPVGATGDVLLVNGAPHPYFEVAARKYRLRLLNASNVRSYYFVLDNGMPLTQVGTESGLLPAPISRDGILLGPGQRADVVVDFAGRLGQNIVLRNQGGIGRLAQVMQFRVRRDEADPSTVPPALRAARPAALGEVAVERTWVLSQNPVSQEWTINGQGFDHHRVDAQPKLGTVERWTFINASTSDHIVHIHDVDWRVIARTGPLPEHVDADEAGAKESFRVETDEVVVVEARFTDHVGRYLWHCHFLEHEDYSMMTQFEVTP